MHDSFALLYYMPLTYTQIKQSQYRYGTLHNLAFEEPAESLKVISALSCNLEDTACPLSLRGFN